MGKPNAGKRGRVKSKERALRLISGEVTRDFAVAQGIITERAAVSPKEERKHITGSAAVSFAGTEVSGKVDLHVPTPEEVETFTPGIKWDRELGTCVLNLLPGITLQGSLVTCDRVAEAVGIPQELRVVGE